MPTIENATITPLGSGYEIRPNNGYVLYDITTANDEYQIYSYVIAVPNIDCISNIIAVPISEVPADAIICGDTNKEETI